MAFTIWPWGAMRDAPAACLQPAWLPRLACSARRWLEVTASRPRCCCDWHCAQMPSASPTPLRMRRAGGCWTSAQFRVLLGAGVAVASSGDADRVPIAGVGLPRYNLTYLCNRQIYDLTKKSRDHLSGVVFNEESHGDLRFCPFGRLYTVLSKPLACRGTTLYTLRGCESAARARAGAREAE